MPPALSELRCYNGLNTVATAVESHMAGHAIVLVDARQRIADTIAFGPCLAYRGHQQLSGVIPVAGINFRLDAITGLKTLGETQPGLVALTGIKEIHGCGTFSRRPGNLHKFRITHAINPKEPGTDPRRPQLGRGSA